MLKEHGFVVSDFDGTITDAEKGQESYDDLVYKKYCDDTGIPRKDFENLMEPAKREVMENQDKYGWEIDGIIVCPPADFILLNQSAIKLVTEKLRKEKVKSLRLPDLSKMSDYLYLLYKYGYSGMELFPREGAKNFVEELGGSNRIAIVTNSSTEGVEEKLKELLACNNIPIYGNAQKFILDNKWKEKSIPIKIRPDGFPVDEYLRRPNYFVVLDRLKPDIVIGDIRHLDLVLPEYLGIQTALASSKFTPSWEKEYYEKSDTHFIFNSFEELVA